MGKRVSGTIKKRCQEQFPGDDRSIEIVPDTIVALVMPHAEYLRLGADATERCVAYRELFKEVLSADRLAEIRAYVQQQRVLGTPRFQREIEAMIKPQGI